MSSGLMFNNCANCSSFAFCTSKLLWSTFQTSPFTTIKGSELVNVLMVDAPRKRIVVPAPKLPEFITISKPAIRPCKASSTEVKPKPSNSLALIVCEAKETSRSGIARPEDSTRFLAFTSTCFNTIASSNVTWYTFLLIGRIWVFIPT